MRSDLKRSGLREVWGRRSALRKRQYSPAYKQDNVSSVTASDWSSWSNPSSGTFPSKTEIITEKRKMKGNIFWLYFWICHCSLLQCMATSILIVLFFHVCLQLQYVVESKKWQYYDNFDFGSTDNSDFFIFSRLLWLQWWKMFNKLRRGGSIKRQWLWQGPFYAWYSLPVFSLAKDLQLHVILEISETYYSGDL